MSNISRFIFHDRRLALLWTVVRVYVGWQWFEAGREKVVNPAWVGSGAGGAVKGFLTGALNKTTGPHPDVSAWYAWLISHIGLPQAFVISHLVAVGELVVGVALILGIFVGIAAFFGSFMNMNYLLAGTISTNPVLLLLGILLILARRPAGWYGLDRFRPSVRRR